MNDKKLPHHKPDIRIFGEITEEKVEDFLKQLDKALESDGPLVIEVNTIGGDADAGRRVAAEIRFHQRINKREFYFFGKVAVYSIGVVIMSAFPKDHRFLLECTRLMIHERRIDKEVHFDAALSSCIQSAKELLSQFKTGYEIEKEDFVNLVKGSTLTVQAVMDKVDRNWYIPADKAVELGLVEGLV